jgi:hypothetical protein
MQHGSGVETYVITRFTRLKNSIHNLPYMHTMIDVTQQNATVTRRGYNANLAQHRSIAIEQMIKKIVVESLQSSEPSDESR